ncbi:Aspartic proteinase CDR1 [Platanthera guangdongensis]|uniref:Aspartic proteinase CDR1 n=1 Tax=Platanthera guangdongensis TaxID=2320717 RepID=A0ABR2LMM0_9ASPA
MGRSALAGPPAVEPTRDRAIKVSPTATEASRDPAASPCRAGHGRGCPWSDNQKKRAALLGPAEDAVRRQSGRHAGSYAAEIDIHSDIIPNTFEYLMTFYIGTPPEKLVAIADTGSDLIWVQCSPCKLCYTQKPPLFDPSSSSTYKSVSCNDDSCAALPESGCAAGDHCQYHYSYGDRSYVVGDLSVDTLSFDSAEAESPVQIPKILFGCTHESNGTFGAAGAGLVGLGGGQLSLITQLGDSIDHKFSYCLPTLSKNQSFTGRLNFGSNAVVSGTSTVSTPIVPGDPETFFFLKLEYISISGENRTNTAAPIAVKPATQNRGNIIIDSGTTLTLIDDESVRSLAAQLTKTVKLPSLCFDVSGAAGNSTGEDESMPDIIFHFAEDADVVLKPLNAFVMTDDATLCLAIVSNRDLGGGGGDISIFGNIAQQNYEIGYDLGAMRLTFSPANCTAA